MTNYDYDYDHELVWFLAACSEPLNHMSQVGCRRPWQIMARQGHKAQSAAQGHKTSDPANNMQHTGTQVCHNYYYGITKPKPKPGPKAWCP